jgi:5'-deoxynucleotidase YfbR-like HD superfamily hydrolase
MNVINFFQKINRLKSLKRTGWLKKGVAFPESVADHTFRVALIAMILCPENLNKEKIIKMAIVNELPEAIVGDIITTHENSNKYKKNKFKKEKNAVQELVKKLDKKTANEIINLWVESEELKTKEAKFLKQIDKLEMAMQALEYEKLSSNQEKFDEFWETTENTLENPELIEIFNELKNQRK